MNAHLWQIEQYDNLDLLITAAIFYNGMITQYQKLAWIILLNQYLLMYLTEHQIDTSVGANNIRDNYPPVYNIKFLVTFPQGFSQKVKICKIEKKIHQQKSINFQQKMICAKSRTHLLMQKFKQ